MLGNEAFPECLESYGISVSVRLLVALDVEPRARRWTEARSWPAVAGARAIAREARALGASHCVPLEMQFDGV